MNTRHPKNIRTKIIAKRDITLRLDTIDDSCRLLFRYNNLPKPEIVTGQKIVTAIIESAEAEFDIACAAMRKRMSGEIAAHYGRSKV